MRAFSQCLSRDLVPCLNTDNREKKIIQSKYYSIAECRLLIYRYCCAVFIQLTIEISIFKENQKSWNGDSIKYYLINSGKPLENDFFGLSDPEIEVIWNEYIDFSSLRFSGFIWYIQMKNVSQLWEELVLVC